MTCFHTCMRYWMLLCACLALSACIVVDDWGGFWEKAGRDADLAGAWRNVRDDGDTIRFSSTVPDSYSMTFADSNETPAEVRTLILGTHRFLLMQDAQNRDGGNMMFYKLDGKRLIFYRPDVAMRGRFLKRFPHSGIEVTVDTVRVKKLDMKALETIAHVACDPTYWVESSRYRR